MKKTPLLKHGRAVHQSHRLSQFTTSISDHRLQSTLRSHAAFPQAIDQALPRRFALVVSHLPVQDLAFATAISPQAQRHQQHYFLAVAFLALAAPLVHLEGVRLRLHPQPDAIKLHPSRHLRNALVASLLQQGFDLIDALIDGP